MSEDKKVECPACQNVEKAEEPAQESIMKFPMEFPIKIMGLTRDDFVSTIENVVREFAPDLDTSKNQVECSKSKKYTSLTLFINATSRQQLDSIYMALTKHPFVKIVL